MKVYRFIKSKDKEEFKVPSSSTVGLYHIVSKLHTTADTFVYRCDCIGYVTRGHKIKDYECKHIKSVKEFEEKEKGNSL
jgi:hypothetical protein